MLRTREAAVWQGRGSAEQAKVPLCLQVGIVSFGPVGCGGVAHIAGYTNVSAVQPWVASQVRRIARSLAPLRKQHRPSKTKKRAAAGRKG